MTPNSRTLVQTWKTRLYSAVIADTLDTLGFHHQVATPGVLPLDDTSVICGRVRTGIYMLIFHDDADTNVYENEIKLIDDLHEDDVAVIICHGNQQISPWGELLSTRAKYLKAGGCLTDGSVRDVRQIRDMGFPVFTAGRNPADTKYRGKMMMYDVPAEFCGVRIQPGDLVFADIDGIVFIPAHATEEVTRLALEKVSTETTVRQELEGGASLQEIFERHEIL